MKYSRNNLQVGIKSTGFYVPENILRNSDFSHINGTAAEWIEARTGIIERRKSSSFECTSDLACKAANMALEKGELSPDKLDCIIVATSSPDTLFPSTACVVQHKLNATGASAFDISAACSGFIYGLDIARNMILTGYYKNIMIIGAETLTRFINWQDKNTAFLFGDGAGSVILSPANGEKEIIASGIASDGSGASLLSLPAGGSRCPIREEIIKKKLHYIHMKGREVFKACIKGMTASIEEVLKKMNMNILDIDHFIPHQANQRIIDAIVKKLGLLEDRVYVNLNYFGNTGAASIPIALAEAIEKNKFSPGDIILLSSFGAGLTCGSCIIKW